MNSIKMMIGSILLFMLLIGGSFADYTDAEHEYIAGNGFFLLGDLPQAELAYENATSLDPSLAVAWNNLGIVRKKMGNFNQSAAAYEKALEITSEDDSIWYNYGLVLDSLKRYDESRLAYQKAVTLNPNLTPAWFNLTASLARNGNNAEADEAFSKGSALDPQFAANWSYPDSVDYIPGTEKSMKSPLSLYGVLIALLSASCLYIAKKW